MSTLKEPFLDDQRIVFRPSFFLFDLSINTSEIQYFHLNIPKNTITKLTDAPIQQTTPSVAPLPSESERPKGKLLDTSVLQPKEKMVAKISRHQDQGDQQQKPAIPRRKMEQQQKQVEEQEPPPKPEQPPQKPRRQQKHSSLPNFQETNSPRSLEEFWVKPLKSTEKDQFIFCANGDDYLYITNDTNEILLHAVRTNTGFDIINGGDKVAEVKQHNDNSLFLVTTAEKPVNREISAVKFNQSFTQEDQPRLFDIYIPALKKHEGEHIIWKIDVGETSGLIARVEQKQKEAITMTTRVPPNTGNSFDLTFEGIFKVPDRHNFVVYHQSQPKRHVATLGCVQPNLYHAYVTYPMCPLQGFFACIASHHKD